MNLKNSVYNKIAVSAIILGFLLFEFWLFDVSMLLFEVTFPVFWIVSFLYLLLLVLKQRRVFLFGDHYSLLGGIIALLLATRGLYGLLTYSFEGISPITWWLSFLFGVLSMLLFVVTKENRDSTGVKL